jgi:F-type H+-transporting ATPase subunit epsilon
MTTAPSFTLTVSKVNGPLFSGEAYSVTVPGTEGELTLLANHEPMITLLKKGMIIVRTAEGVQEFAIEKGLCETSHGQITILV